LNEPSAFGDQRVRFGRSPPLHDAILYLLTCINFRMSRDACQRSELGSGLSRDKRLEPPETEKVPKPARYIDVIAIYGSEQQRFVCVSLKLRKLRHCRLDTFPASRVGS
jgi:hypothetical protein